MPEWAELLLVVAIDALILWAWAPDPERLRYSHYQEADDGEH